MRTGYDKKLIYPGIIYDRFFFTYKKYMKNGHNFLSFSNPNNNYITTLHKTCFCVETLHLKCTIIYYMKNKTRGKMVHGWGKLSHCCPLWGVQHLPLLKMFLSCIVFPFLGDRLIVGRLLVIFQC